MLTFIRVFMDLGFPFTPSALLLSTAPSTFDLFRAMYPVSHSSELSRSRSNRLQYSNDAKYLADAAQNLRARCDAAKVEAAGDRFDETAERLSVVSASWLDDTIVSSFNVSSMGPIAKELPGPRDAKSLEANE